MASGRAALSHALTRQGMLRWAGGAVPAASAQRMWGMHTACSEAMPD